MGLTGLLNKTSENRMVTYFIELNVDGISVIIVEVTEVTERIFPTKLSLFWIACTMSLLRNFKTDFYAFEYISLLQFERKLYKNLHGKKQIFFFLFF
jgi:hypothetical protein